jgi:hypothetical protein
VDRLCLFFRIVRDGKLGARDEHVPLVYRETSCVLVTNPSAVDQSTHRVSKSDTHWLISGHPSATVPAPVYILYTSTYLLVSGERWGRGLPDVIVASNTVKDIYSKSDGKSQQNRAY